MIVVNLKGGLGNQMFQYAFGKALSIRNSDEVLLDTSGLSRANEVGDIYRPFTLSAFNIKASIASAETAARMKDPYGIFSKLWRRFSFKVLRRQNIGWNPRAARMRGDIYLDGYWQSPKYFEPFELAIREEFTLAEPLSPAAAAIAERMQSSNSIMLHVRRGDYVSNKAVAAAYGPCTPAYYERAVAYLSQHVQDPSWFIFSDDIAWVKEHLPLPGNVTYVSETPMTDPEELVLMAACKHNIIANSTFSWWGAWLNPNPEKIVAAPTPWIDAMPREYADLIPASWIQLPKY